MTSLSVVEGVTMTHDPICMADELIAIQDRIKKYRGHEFLGIQQKEFPQFDEDTLGLRGLILLAGQPNVGKTILGTQFGVDSVYHNRDVCFLFVSLEMSRFDIYLRIISRWAKLDWDVLLCGRKKDGSGSAYTDTEIKSLKNAEHNARTCAFPK